MTPTEPACITRLCRTRCAAADLAAWSLPSQPGSLHMGLWQKAWGAIAPAQGVQEGDGSVQPGQHPLSLSRCCACWSPQRMWQRTARAVALWSAVTGAHIVCRAQQALWLLLLQGACPLPHTTGHRAGTCCTVTTGAAARPERMPAQQIVRLRKVSAASGHGRQRTKPSLELSSFTVLLLFHPGRGGSAVSRRGLTSEAELPATCQQIGWLQGQDTTTGGI